MGKRKEDRTSAALCDDPPVRQGPQRKDEIRRRLPNHAGKELQRYPVVEERNGPGQFQGFLGKIDQAGAKKLPDSGSNASPFFSIPMYSTRKKGVPSVSL